MSVTLEVEERAEEYLDTEPLTSAFLREFCTVCYTDNVSVRADGSIFCPECGHTSTHA